MERIKILISPKVTMNLIIDVQDDYAHCKMIPMITVGEERKTDLTITVHKN